MTSPIQTSDAWIRARDRYVQDLCETEQQIYFNASPESLLDDASAAEKSHGTTSTTRRVMEKLQPLVAAIEQYGDAIDVYSNTYSLALGPIWGSIKVLLYVSSLGGLKLFNDANVVLPIRSHASLANTSTSLLICLQGSAMSYHASEYMKDYSRTMSV